MNLLTRFIILLMMSVAFAAPVNAAVTVDMAGYCDIVADDDKKGDGEKKDGEDEPECE